MRQLHTPQGLPTPTGGLARSRSLYAPGAILSALPGTAFPAPRGLSARAASRADCPRCLRLRPPGFRRSGLRPAAGKPQRPRGLSPQARRDHAEPSARCLAITTLHAPGAPHRLGADRHARKDIRPTTLHRGERQATYNYQVSVVVRGGLKGDGENRRRGTNASVLTTFL